MRPRQHGSTLLLVLAILSVLVLVAAGLAYTSRIEGAASANFAQATQARMAANTGLPYSLALLRSIQSEPVSPVQAWQKAPQALQQAGRQSALVGRSARGRTDLNALYSKALHESGLEGEDVRMALEAGMPPANVTVTDLSGRVNINAIRSDRALGRVIQAALSGQTESRSISADARARAILTQRSQGGRSSGSGQGNRRAAPLSSSDPLPIELLDPRRERPANGLHRFDNLNELSRRGPGGRSALFTPDEVESLSKVMTVFSQSPEVYHRDDGTTIPKLSLSEATAEQILDVLMLAFPEKDEALLRQFAVNVADALDEDRVPTTLSLPGDETSETLVFGVEPGTPFITEVYPDARTPEEGEDRGQFVEIHNPWPQPLLLAGWKLESAQGASVALNVVIPSGGFVVVTDNYESPAEDAAPETGSLVSIFGTRADGSQRKVIEEPDFVLADKDSSVRLVDELGNLIDLFTWNSEAGTDSTQSYQRDDPRVRVATVAEATPFERPWVRSGSLPKEAQGAFEDVKSFAAAEGSRLSVADSFGSGETSGTWLLSPVDLLQVPTAYASVGTDSQTGRVKLVAHAWQRPVRKVTDEEDPTNLDARVLDLFTTVKPADGGKKTSLRTRSGDSSEVRRTRGMPAHHSSANVISSKGARTGAGTRMVASASGATPSRPGIRPAATSRTGSGAPAAGGGARRFASGKTSADRAAAEARIRAFEQGQTLTGTSAAGLAIPLSARQPDRFEEADSVRQDPDETTVTLPLLYAYGRLNLNTASRLALYGLDGEVDGHDYLPSKTLDAIDRYRAERLREGKTPFRNVSDLLSVVFPEPSDAELRAFAKVLEQVTVDSCAFEITSENRVAGAGDPKRRAARAQMRWVIALDRSPVSLIDYAELH